MKPVVISVLTLCITSMIACAGTPRPAPTANQEAASSAPSAGGPRTGRPCLSNFSEEGSFWTGKTFRSFQEFQKVDRDKAFLRIAQQVAADGWQGMNAQKDIGVITATQTVSYGQGKQAPLNIVVKSMGPDGLRVEVVFTTSGGLKVSVKDMQDEFCKLLEAAAE